MCEQHQKMSAKYQVTRQVWKDCGVSKKVTKLVCRARKDLPEELKNSTCDRSMSEMASSGQKVRVTCDGGLASGD